MAGLPQRAAKIQVAFENKKCRENRTIKGPADPTGNPGEVQLLQKMQQWLRRYHSQKTDGEIQD